MKIIILFLSLFFGNLNLALANDTLYSVHSGNIEFKKSKDISMESEDLFISIQKIKIKYQFKNQSKENLKELVTFPLPQFSLESPYDLALVKPDSDEVLANPLHFELKVNGVITPTKMDARVVSDDRTLDLKYFWTQEFPSQKITTIEHSYLTGAGSSFPQEAEKTYCFDKSFNEALEKLKKKLSLQFNKNKKTQKTYGTVENYISVYLHFNTRVIDYILKTGANWNGPIKNFKLTLDKSDSKNIMSLCRSDLKKISSTVFEFAQTNFTPTEDLHILIVDTKKVEAF